MTLPPPEPDATPVSVVLRLSLAEVELVADALTKLANFRPNRMREVVVFGVAHPELGRRYGVEL